jgi:hypothetical protein
VCNHFSTEKNIFEGIYKDGVSIRGKERALQQLQLFDYITPFSLWLARGCASYIFLVFENQKKK